MLHTHCHTRRQERGVYTIMTALVLVDALYPRMVKPTQEFPWWSRIAGQLAGLRVERLLNEPTAAALADIHHGIHET